MEPLTAEKPWLGETVQIPNFFDGCKVVSGIKLATAATETASQWVVVAESNGTKRNGPRGTWMVLRLTFVRHWQEQPGPVKGVPRYADAVALMLDEVQRTGLIRCC